MDLIGSLNISYAPLENGVKLHKFRKTNRHKCIRDYCAKHGLDLTKTSQRELNLAAGLLREWQEFGTHTYCYFSIDKE